MAKQTEISVLENTIEDLKNQLKIAVERTEKLQEAILIYVGLADIDKAKEVMEIYRQYPRLMQGRDKADLIEALVEGYPEDTIETSVAPMEG